MILRRIPSLPSWATGLRDLDVARREMERLFDSLTESTGVQTAGVFPAINVSQGAEAIFVRAELPGIKPDDLEISIENDTVTIAGERARPSEAGDVSYHRRERGWGKFRRSFSIPTRVDSGKVQAKYVDGILTVTLPKAAEAKPKQITVQAGA